MAETKLVYVSQYRTQSRYGGPEEGGWYVRINQYFGNSIGPFVVEKATEVQKLAQEVAWKTNTRIGVWQMENVRYFLEEEKGMYHKEWEDVPREEFYYQ